MELCEDLIFFGIVFKLLEVLLSVSGQVFLLLDTVQSSLHCFIRFNVYLGVCLIFKGNANPGSNLKLADMVPVSTYVCGLSLMGRIKS